MSSSPWWRRANFSAWAKVLGPHWSGVYYLWLGAALVGHHRADLYDIGLILLLAASWYFQQLPGHTLRDSLGGGGRRVPLAAQCRTVLATTGIVVLWSVYFPAGAQLLTEAGDRLALALIAFGLAWAVRSRDFVTERWSPFFDPDLSQRYLHMPLSRSAREFTTTAVHEAGHALLFAHPQLRPYLRSAEIVRNSAELARSRYAGIVTHHDFPRESERLGRWGCLMSLAGLAAERAAGRTSNYGGYGDLYRWECLARRYLSHQPGIVLFFHRPSLAQEQYNAEVLARFKQQLFDELADFFAAHHSQLLSLAAALEDEGHLSGAQIAPWLAQIRWPAHWPVPTDLPAVPVAEAAA